MLRALLGALGCAAMWAAQAQVPAASTPAALPIAAPFTSTAASTSREARPLADDPALEARVMKIAEELRCLVCQNETIAASHADLAVDLRKQIRIKLAEGRSDQQILDFMVERYGDFVLYRPPWKATTVLLWAGPFALLLVGAVVLALNVRKRRRGAAVEGLSAAQAERARALLGESEARP